MAASDLTYGFATRAIHAGECPDPVTGARNPPLYQTSTFVMRTLEDKAAIESGVSEGWTYTRTGNPTTAMLERKIANLEGADAAVAGASGMAVIAGTFYGLVQPGDHILASDDLYSWSETLLDEQLPSYGIEVERVNITDIDGVRAAVRPETKMIFTEFLANPTMRMADVPALASIAGEHENLILVVDNTFTSPYLFRPLEHGANISLHSATKYLSGHADVIAGVAAGRRDLIDRIDHQIQGFGATISPFNSWLLMRGIKTLGLRMKQHCENAMQIARFLERQPEIVHINYPGLPNHAQHERASELLDGRYGGMLSFRLKGGERASNLFADSLELCDHAVSLGDVYTLVWPHREELVRVSIGCEDADDIERDFERALEKTANGSLFMNR